MPYSIAKMAKKFWNFVLRRQEANVSDDIEMPRIQQNGGANGVVEVTKRVQFHLISFFFFDFIYYFIKQRKSDGTNLTYRVKILFI